MISISSFDEQLFSWVSAGGLSHYLLCDPFTGGVEDQNWDLLNAK